MTRAQILRRYRKTVELTSAADSKRVRAKQLRNLLRYEIMEQRVMKNNVDEEWGYRGPEFRPTSASYILALIEATFQAKQAPFYDIIII